MSSVLCSERFCTLACRTWLRHAFHVSATSRDGPSARSASRRTLSELLETVAPQSQAKAKSRKKPSRRTVAEDSPVERHLAHIDSTKHILVLSDLEHYRPQAIPDTRSSTYDIAYTDLQLSLTKSFSVSQLVSFLKLYNIRPSLRTKNVLVSQIMEYWGWPSLHAAREERSDLTEMAHLQFVLEPGDAFLFMGKDGENLLALSRQYDVHMSFSANPLTLKVDGLKGALKEINDHMTRFKEDIRTTTISLPLGYRISAPIAKSISRLSGSYVHTQEDGQLELTFLESVPNAVEQVRRLAVQAAVQESNCVVDPLCFGLSHPYMADSPYHLYPSYPFQVTTRKLASESTFRLRQVGSFVQNINSSAENGAGIERPNSHVKDSLINGLGNSSVNEHKTNVTASLGHFLFISKAQHPTLVPPITGRIMQDTVHQWVNRNPSHVLFNPSVPNALSLSWPHQQRRLSRLTYKANTGSGKSIHNTLSIDIYHESQNADRSKVACQLNVETRLNVLLPGRHVDIQIAAEQQEPVSTQELPLDLRNHIEQIWKGSSPAKFGVPLVFELRDTPYSLLSEETILQNYQMLDLHKSNDNGPNNRSKFLMETRTDSETGYQSLVCKLIARDGIFESGWEDFMEECRCLSVIDEGHVPHRPSDLLQPWLAL